MDRKEFIQKSLDLGKTPDQISEKLAFNGYDPLSTFEERDIVKGVYGKNTGQKFLKDIHDLGAGVATIIGAGANYLTDSNFNQYVNKKASELSLGDIGGMLTENWNYNPATFAIDPKQGALDILAGLNTNPGLATLDLAPIIGKGVTSAKTLTKGIKSTKATGNISEYSKTLTGDIINNNRVVNDILDVAKEAPSSELTKLRNVYADIKSKYTPEEIAKAYENLEAPIEGKWVGNSNILDATKDLNKFAREVDSIMKKVGVNPNKAEEVAVFQNMSRMFKNDAGLTVNIDDLVKASEGNTKAINKLQSVGIDGNVYSDYFNRASELFNQGLIFPVRHASMDVKGAKGLITLEDLKKGALAERKYGTQSYEELGKAFQEGGYEPLLKDLEKAKQSTGALNEIVNTIGVKVEPGQLPKLSKGEVLVSPQVLQEVVGATLENGGKLDNAIRKTLQSFSDSPEGLPVNDMYILRKKDLGAIENAMVSDKKLPQMLNNLASIGKQNALSTTNYIAGNFLANITSNMATGVLPKHYWMALNNKADIPDALKRMTSYQGYLGKDVDVNAKVKEVYKTLFKDIADNKNSFDTRFKIAHSITNYPIFRLASNVEIIDRGANFFKNAERVAKELGKDIKEVIEEAKVNGGNNSTFREIKRRIDNDLGDYIGHNYYIDPRIEEAVRATVPFYRPYTQGARVLSNIAQNYPGYYQTQIKLPAYLGNQLSAYGETKGVTPDEEYKGAPINTKFGKVPSRVMYSPYHNVTAVGEVAGGAVAGNPELLPSVNTFAITPFLSLMGLNRYGQEAKLPNSYTVNGQQVTIDNNGNILKQEPSVTDRIKLFLAQTTQVYAPGVNTINKSILPVIARITGEDYRVPSDYSIFGQLGDNSIPLLSEGNKTARVTPREKILPTIGITIKSTYPKRRETLSINERKSALKQRYYNRLRNERR